MGALLIHHRCAAHLTDEELAELVGFSPHYVGMLERAVRLPASRSAGKSADALPFQLVKRTVLGAAAERALTHILEMSSRLVHAVPLAGR